jgi:UDP-glucose 4-epimerase/GR25 family glycosyltransferase involved in LPS biosynthesis
MKSFIIHLSKIPASLNTALEVKRQLEAFGMEAELFEGSYGNEVKERYAKEGRRYHPWNFKNGPENPFPEEFRDSQQNPGEMGCFDSHYRLWEKCVELNEPILIFEDDVIFERPYLPVTFNEVLITVFGNLTKSAKYFHFYTSPTGDPRAEWYGQASMPGTPGYAIKPAAAKKLVEMYKNTWLPSDNAMMINIVGIQVHSHVMGRALISEDGKKSLVRGKNNFWEKQEMKKKILITGNSGYIGSHLTQLLIKDSNIEIHGLDKNNPIKSVSKFFHRDITHDTEWYIEDEYDCVIHLAAEVAVGRSVETPTLYYQTNTIGTLNVLKKIKTKRLVIASTGAAAGLGSPYGISKKAMEDVVFEYCKNNNIPFTIFRFYNVTGSDGIEPTNPDGLFASLIAATRTGNFTIFGDNYNTEDGTCIRDYTHVNEICYSVIEAIDKSTNQIENLGHGIGTSVKQMVEIFKRVNETNFNVTIGSRREGDLEKSVLTDPSPFMKKLYPIEDLLTIKK